jgi:triacylglycerol lipase
MTTFSVSQLVESPSSASWSASSSGFNPPSSFNAQYALLLAQCCGIAYEQYVGSATIPPPDSDLSSLPSTFNSQTATYSQLGSLTASESIGLGSPVGSASDGAYRTVPFGLVIQVSLGGVPAFNVLVLRGTQTYQEWINDGDILPAAFAVVQGAGDVHGGFYATYTTGSDGTLQTSSATRPSGSLAAQISQLSALPGWSSTLPLYITGHSLGAALAIFCAMDVATNFASCCTGVSMYCFAPPLISAGITYQGYPFASATTFPTAYNTAVPSSFAVVNAADLVPILPMSLGNPASAQIQFLAVVPVANTAVYCAQVGTLGGNHSLADNYLPYTQQLAASFTAAPRPSPRTH